VCVAMSKTMQPATHVLQSTEGTVSSGALDPTRPAVLTVAGTLHLTLNAVIDEVGEEPSVSSVMLLVVPASTTPLTTAAHVRQTFRRTPEGWMISSRTITLPSATPT
jgi:hypothetical protein